MNNIAGVVFILLLQVLQYPDFLLCLPMKSFLVTYLKTKTTIRNREKHWAYLIKIFWLVLQENMTLDNKEWCDCNCKIIILFVSTHFFLQILLSLEDIYNWIYKDCFPYSSTQLTGEITSFTIQLKGINKNDNIHKNEVEQISWSDEYWQYTLAANITEYHIISKLILQRIISINLPSNL